MSKKKGLWNLFKNGGFFILLLLVTFYFIFRSQDMGSVLRTVTEVNPIYIGIAIGCMCLFICCEAINIERTLTLYRCDTSFAKCVKYALTGFFFSSITPMASGGQPAQMYYMYRDHLEISYSALAIMMELASFQFITVMMAIFGYMVNFSFFNEMGYHIQYILLAGVLLNTVILGLILMAFFSKTILEKCINGLFALLKLFRVKKIEEIRIKVQYQIDLYRRGAAAFQKNKGTVAKILLTTLVQITAFHSIPFWIYRAFGYEEYSFMTVLLIQAVLYITVSAIPLPGSVGASESGFILIFRTLFPAQVIQSAMLLSRGISFYLFLCISGIFLLVIHALYRGKTRECTQPMKIRKIH
ncbi:lysylphosphatidylglycerol synthase transmembrane domain-containing protein [Aminipila luticellarii]|nr:lysylphosphatidylglycerol synthase transmembrane domain-containing protein [Aminipila luticellarii]